MALVVYKCDVCKREKEFLRNIEGIEKIQRCTITHGCRGKLYQSKVLPDFVRAKSSARVAGLDDWRQRKVLHNHTQSIARSEWLIEHNLGTFPSISVFVNIPIENDPENVEELLPTDIIVVDENTMQLIFDRAWSGLAQLVARQSSPDLLKSYTRTGVTETILTQISNAGFISIATRISTTGECVGGGSPSSSDVKLNVTYNTTQNTIATEQYTVDRSNGTTTDDAPWSDMDRVVIRGKIYIVRSFNAVTGAMTDETIGSGSTFRFTGIEHRALNSICTNNIWEVARPVAQDEVYILFADAPFETADKQTMQYIDVYDITETENSFAFVYDSNEFYADSDIIQKIYPPIRSVVQ